MPGTHVVAAEQASDFGLDARPGAGAELAQQLAVEAGVQPQTFGDGQHDLPVGDGKTDLFGHVDGGQQGAFLVAGGAGAALLAGKGDEHLVVAVRAADAGEALVQIAAVEKGRHGALDDRPPEAVLGLETARRRPAGRSRNAGPSSATGRRPADRVDGTAAAARHTRRP